MFSRRVERLDWEGFIQFLVSGLTVAVVIFGVVLLFMMIMEDEVPIPAQGVVTNREYDDPDRYMTKVGAVWMTNRDEAHWNVRVTNAQGQERWVEVPQSTYDTCQIGDRWTYDAATEAATCS